MKYAPVLPVMILGWMLNLIPAGASAAEPLALRATDGATGEGIGTVAVLAAQGATGQAHEYRGQPSRSRFTLQRVKDFGDA